MGSNKVVVGVIKYRGKIIIGRKNPNSGKWFAGKWHLPGETLEQGESYEDALKRGMKAETGLEVQVGRQLASHVSPNEIRVNWYECSAIGGELKAGEDLVEVRAVEKREVQPLCGERVVPLWPDEIKKYF